MSRYLDDKNTPVELDKLDSLNNEQLTEAVSDLTDKLKKTSGEGQALRVWLMVAFGMIAVLIGIIWYLHPANQKPKTPAIDNQQVTTLTNEVSSFKAQVVALQDSLMAVRKIAAAAKADAAHAVDQTEVYGGRVDEVALQLNRLDLSGLAKKK